MNRVILIGRATKDFELRYTPAGVAVANGTIAVDRPTGQGRDKETDFINLVAWKQLAETCANYVHKGHKFAVEGRIQVRSYDNNEGRKVYVTEVHADRVEFLESKDSTKETTPTRQGDPFANSKPLEISDDDLPF